MKIELSSRQLIICLMLFLAASTILNIGSPDSLFWFSWTSQAIVHGLAKGYELNRDVYPPLTTIFLFLSAKLAKLVGLHFYWGIKLTLSVFLFVSTAIIYRWSKRNIEFTFYCYLSLLLSSLCLTYTDIFFCPPIFLTFYFISKNKIAPAAFFFSVAVFIKYPSLMIAPFLAVYLINLLVTDNNKLGAFIKVFVTKLVMPVLWVFIPIIVFFGASVFDALGLSFQERMLSGQALNMGWIITRVLQIFPDWSFSKDGWQANSSVIFLASQWSIIALKFTMAAFYLSVFARFLSTPKNIESLLLFCILGHMSYFIFNYGVHENHLFLSCILAIVLACINSRFTQLAITLSIISSLNLMAFYGVAGTMPDNWPTWYVDGCAQVELSFCTLGHARNPYFDLRLLLAIFNTAYFVYLWLNIVCKNQIPALIRTAN